jgi:hypothetical protein
MQTKHFRRVTGSALIFFILFFFINLSITTLATPVPSQKLLAPRSSATPSPSPSKTPKLSEPSHNNNFISKAKVKGIYVTQYNFENTAFLTYLIKHAKAAGIDTLIVDFELPSQRYKNNIALLKNNKIHYVARIIMFPGGASHADLENPAYWQKKYSLVQQAIDWGAEEIQLDYIRYSSKEKASDGHDKVFF